jgi:hypothetical protein
MFDYVPMHTVFRGPANLVTLMVLELDDTSPVVLYTGIVYRPPTDSTECGIAWKKCTRERWDLA